MLSDDRDYKDTSIDPNESLISELGIFGKALTPTLALGTDLRSNMGVYVVATTAGADADRAGLAPGDVIASLNGMPILNIPELRKAIREVIGRKPVVLRIERHGRYLYIEPDFEDRPSVSGCRSRCSKRFENGTGSRQALTAKSLAGR